MNRSQTTNHDKPAAGLAALILAATIAAGLGAAGPARAAGDRVTVPLSNPGKPARIDVSLVSGAIDVAGYDGAEVVVDAKVTDDDEKGDHPVEREGLHRIPNTSSGLSVEEKDNQVSIRTESWRHATDLTIKVPRHTSLKLATVNNGDIKITGVNGEIEATNVNGGIRLDGVSGSAVVNTVNGDVTAVFRQIEPQKAMSFTTLNGDVDVTLPPTAKADVRMATENGDIYSDFELNVQPTAIPVADDKGKEKDKDKDRGRGFKVRIGHEMRGQLNGGGPEFYFKSFNGDILVRKAK
jgi:Toastrack DUF4097